MRHVLCITTNSGDLWQKILYAISPNTKRHHNSTQCADTARPWHSIGKLWDISLPSLPRTALSRQFYIILHLLFFISVCDAENVLPWSLGNNWSKVFRADVFKLAMIFQLGTCSRCFIICFFSKKKKRFFSHTVNVKHPKNVFST